MISTPRVAAWIAGSCLGRSGQPVGSAYLPTAVRGGLLADLALTGRLTQTDDGIEIDTDLIGYPPADRVRVELESLDGQSLEWWLGRSRIGLDDVAAAEIAAGRWTVERPRRWHRTPRYSVDPSPVDARVDAAGSVLTAAAGLRAEPGEDLLPRTGEAAWVCEFVAAYLREARTLGTAVGDATRLCD